MIKRLYSTTVVVALMCAAAFAGSPVVQSCAAGAVGQSISCTLPSAMTVGDVVLVGVFADSGSANLTFGQGCGITWVAGPSASLWASYIGTVATSESCTLNLTSSVVTNGMEVFGVELDNTILPSIQALNNADVSNPPVGTTGSGAVTTTETNEFVLSFFSSPNWSGSRPTAVSPLIGFTFSSDGGGDGTAAYEIAAAAGDVSPQWTIYSGATGRLDLVTIAVLTTSSATASAPCPPTLPSSGGGCG